MRRNDPWTRPHCPSPKVGDRLKPPIRCLVSSRHGHLASTAVRAACAPASGTAATTSTAARAACASRRRRSHRCVRRPARAGCRSRSRPRAGNRSGRNHGTRRKKTIMSESPGSTTVVVGASRGLGRRIARAFAEAGAPVVAVARAGPDLAELDTASANIPAEVADAADATVAWNLLAHNEPGVLILVVGAGPAMRPMQYEAWETCSVNWHADVEIVFTGLREPLPPGSTLVMTAVAVEIQALRVGETGPVPPVRAESAAEVAGNLFRRESEYWTVRYEGSVARLKDAKGLRYLARLLSDPGREFHAVDLAVAGSPAAQPAPSAERAWPACELRVRPDLGDAGELLDARAKAAYQARLDELAGELEEAERFHDAGRAAKASAERDFLVGELARAVGPGGRDRRAASHAERARLNVTRAIHGGLANLAPSNPPLGRLLAATSRTGRYCSYTPDPRVPITWER